MAWNPRKVDDRSSRLPCLGRELIADPGRGAAPRVRGRIGERVKALKAFADPACDRFPETVPVRPKNDGGWRRIVFVVDGGVSEGLDEVVENCHWNVSARNSGF